MIILYRYACLPDNTEAAKNNNNIITTISVGLKIHHYIRAEIDVNIINYYINIVIRSVVECQII